MLYLLFIRMITRTRSLLVLTANKLDVKRSDILDKEGNTNMVSAVV